MGTCCCFKYWHERQWSLWYGFAIVNGFVLLYIFCSAYPAINNCLHAFQRQHKQEKNNCHSSWSQLIDEVDTIIFLACWLSICKQFPGTVTSPFSGNCYGFVCPRKIMKKSEIAAFCNKEVHWRYSALRTLSALSFFIVLNY